MVWQWLAANLCPPLSHAIKMNLYDFSACRLSLVLFTETRLSLSNNVGRKWRRLCSALGPAVPQECPWRHGFLRGAKIKPGVADPCHYKGVMRTIANEGSLFPCTDNTLYLPYTLYLPSRIGERYTASLHKHDLTHYHNTLSRKLERAKIPPGDLWLLM